MDLFENIQPNKLEIEKDAYFLSGYALTNEKVLMIDLQEVLSQAPLRHMMTKMDFYTSAAMTNCGELGWVSDHNGYCYDRLNPETKKAWPKMPLSFLGLAQNAAIEAGFEDFKPDACLINQYKVGASMGLHQDKNELDFTQPIVSVSLGIPATFQFGGLSRSDKPIKISLTHGDIVVWGGDARLKYHGIMPLKPNNHAVLGPYRYNLTFRKAG
jgi:alkylated DNA repair protein (DNA oxidative demethylase)